MHVTAGNWRGAAEIPKEMLEDAEKQPKGEEKAVFLILDDPWLNNLKV